MILGEIGIQVVRFGVVILYQLVRVCVIQYIGDFGLVLFGVLLNSLDIFFILERKNSYNLLKL